LPAGLAAGSGLGGLGRALKVRSEAIAWFPFLLAGAHRPRNLEILTDFSVSGFPR
jgi:hypothetical protein